MSFVVIAMNETLYVIVPGIISEQCLYFPVLDEDNAQYSINFKADVGFPAANTVSFCFTTSSLLYF